ncbi:MAG: hypothetical protein IPQ07_29040 [Myxococcales bacterium]|nr:hypothetical protein [Myxococcales bacterium]
MRTLISSLFPTLLFTSVLASGACMVGEDEALDATSGVSVTTIGRGLTGCRGKASSSVPANGKYVITTFGGPGDHQSMSCGGYADGSGWYAASRQRYGCGAKLQVTANGKCVVVEAQDYGPDVCVENAAGMPILDVSPKVSRALFNLSGAGWSDHEVVAVEEVAAATPLGPCTTEAEPPAGGGGGGTTPPAATSCMSETLDREVAQGTCVQSAADAQWYSCSAGAWVAKSGTAGCAATYGFCDSATLGESVAPRTCVQARSNSTWYQCNGQGWVAPVDVTAETGALGACSSMHPL